jgi:heat shock protein HslJ
MKKLVALSLFSLVLAGCVNPGKASVQADQLRTIASFWKMWTVKP